MVGALKRLALGRPIPSYRAGHERLGLFTGLAVLSADALSSVACASEEILRVLMVGGAAALAHGPWIAATIAAQLTLVACSCRQTILANPGGGGAYIVARENLGPNASQACSEGAARSSWPSPRRRRGSSRSSLATRTG